MKEQLINDVLLKMQEVINREQLRVLENGYTIKVILTEHQFIGIDTPEDLARIRKYFAKEHQQ